MSLDLSPSDEYDGLGLTTPFYGIYLGLQSLPLSRQEAYHLCPLLSTLLDMFSDKAEPLRKSLFNLDSKLGEVWLRQRLE